MSLSHLALWGHVLCAELGLFHCSLQYLRQVQIAPSKLEMLLVFVDVTLSVAQSGFILY